MSDVNREIYPIRESSLSELSLTIKMSEIPDQTLDTWDTSIAISESMSKNAPFNCINCFTVENNNGPMHSNFRSNDIQKIALYYLESTVNNSGASNRYYNGTINYIFLGRAYEFQAIIYGGKYAPRGWEVTSNFTQYYHPERYYLIDGLKIQNVVCVICVLFTDNSYCSLKYYNDNKQTISKTPMSLFMIGIYGDTVTNSKQNFCPVNMVKNKYDFWRYRNGNFESGLAEAALKYPFGAGTLNPFGDAYGGATAPSDVFPLVACFQGTAPLSKYNWWISSLSVSSVFVIGGIPNEHYTITDAAQFNPVLAQKAFDEAHSIAATYGLPFRDDFPTDIHNVGSGGTVFMPVANDGGYFDGRFEVLSVNGTVSPELSLANLELWNGEKSDIFNKRTYDPTIPIPIDQIDLTQPSVSPIGSFNKTYILNKQEVDAIQAYIYGADDSTLENFLKGISNFGANPMDAFISLHMWPFNVREFVTASATAQVTVGRTPISDATYGDVIGFIMPTNAKAVVDCGTYRIKPKFNSFLDYEPYTTINLYIPFVGTVDLAPSLYMGKRVNVRLICDWVTGATTAVVYADGIPLVYQQGVGAVSISMTGDNHSKTAGDVIGGVIGAAGSAVGAVAAAKTGNFGTAAQFAGKAVEMGSQAFMDYGKTDFTQAGSSSPMCSLYMPMYCYLTISTPKLLIDGDDLAQWAHGVGYADSRVSTLAAEGSSGDGIVIGSPVRISFTGSVQPTPGEIERILQMLSDGVFPS